MMSQSELIAQQDVDVSDAKRTDRSGRPPDAMCVVVVGATGRTGALEADPSVSIARVETLLEAIAFFSVVDRNSDLIHIAALSTEVWDLPALKEFMDALRFVDANASVVHIGPCKPAARELIDGVVSHQMNPDEIRAIIETRPVTELPPPVEVLASEDPEAPPVSSIGDAELVRALMLGEDLIPLATQLIAERLADPSLQFVPQSTSVELSHAKSVMVKSEGRIAGYLVSENRSVTLATLESHSAWLGCWLALDRRFRDQRIEALTDPLTGAWNRRYFDRYLSRAIELAQSSRHTATIMVFDIDEFKKYNDQFGHAAGDEILVEVVRLLRSVIRPSDRVCRIGGDEFAVIFFEPRGPRVPASKPPDSIYRIARRFQSQIGGHSFPKLGQSAPGTLTISGGLATYPWDGRTPQTLLERADQLAIQSKAAGKNVITLGPGASRACREPEDE